MYPISLGIGCMHLKTSILSLPACREKQKHHHSRHKHSSSSEDSDSASGSSGSETSEDTTPTESSSGMKRLHFSLSLHICSGSIGDSCSVHSPFVP